MLPFRNKPMGSEEFAKEIHELMRISLLPNGQREWQYISQPFFMHFLVRILENQSSTEQSKVFVIALIGKIYNEKLQKCSLEETISHLFNIIFSWRIEGKIKYSIRRSIKNVFSHFKQSYDFFEGIFYELLIFIEKFNINDIQESISFAQEFKASYLEKTYVFNITLPQNYIALQYIVLILAECLFYASPEEETHEQQKNLEIVANMQKIHQNIFNKIPIIQNISLFDNLMELWQIIFMNVQQNLLKQKTQLKTMVSWVQIPQHFELIFNENARISQNNAHTYNYLLFNQNWEHKIMNRLIGLKQNAMKMFGEFIALMSLNFVSNGVEYFPSAGNIKNSLNESIFYMAKHYQSLSEHQITLCKSIVSLTGTLIESQSEISLENAQVLFVHVIVPLMNGQSKQQLRDYDKEDQFEEFYNHLNDCCSQQRSQSIMSSLCRLTQICVDKCSAFYYYLREFIKESLIKNSNRFDILKGQNQKTEWITEGIYFSTQCCFLISSLLAYYSLKTQQDFIWLRDLITADYARHLSEYELVHLYLFLTFEWQAIFSQINQDSQYFFHLPLDTKSNILQHVGLQFIVSLNQKYYSHSFILKYLSVFMKIKSRTFKWTLLTKSIKKCLFKFSQEKMCDLLRNFKCQMLNLARCLSQQMDSGTGSIDTSEIYQYLAFCRQISRQHEYIKDKFSLIDQLMEIVRHIKLMNKFWIDDEVVLIAGEVLQCIKVFPSNFIDILQDIIEVFKNSEYQGNGYFHLFSCVIEILTKFQDEEMLMMVYHALEEGISYLAYYPQEMSFDITVSLNNHIILMQNFYLVHGQRLTKIQVSDIKDICTAVLNLSISKGTTSRMLTARAINLKLVCDILQGNEYNYYQILNYAKDKAYFYKYDSCLLLYLLEQVRPYLPVQYCKETFFMLLYFMKTGEQHSKKKIHPRDFQQTNKLNSILHYVQVPVDLEATFNSQAINFLRKFRQAEEGNYNIAKDYYLKYHDSNLQALKYLQQLQSKQSQNSFLDGIKEMQNKLKEFKAEVRSEEKKEIIEANDLQEGEVRLKKKNRTFLRVKGNKIRKQGEDQSDKSSEPKNLKRNIQSLQKCNEQFLMYIKARKKAKRESMDRTCRQRLMERIQSKSTEKHQQKHE